MSYPQYWPRWARNQLTTDDYRCPFCGKHTLTPTDDDKSYCRSCGEEVR